MNTKDTTSIALIVSINVRTNPSLGVDNSY
jgi:hypothetical protein